MPRFNQDSQNDVSIKQRLVKLLKEDAKKFTSTLKVQGVTDANAKIFNELEKALNIYKITLEEFVDTQESLIEKIFNMTTLQKKTENITRYLNEMNTKLKRYGFDVLKSIKQIKSKDLTIGEIDLVSNYMTDLEKLNQNLMIYYADVNELEDVEHIINLYTNIINITTSILTQNQILRNKIDLPQGTIFIDEPLPLLTKPLSGAGYYPKRFH